MIDEAIIREWMSRQKVTTWGRAYDISQESSRQALTTDILNLLAELESIADD